MFFFMYCLMYFISWSRSCRIVSSMRVEPFGSWTDEVLLFEPEAAVVFSLFVLELRLLLLPP